MAAVVPRLYQVLNAVDEPAELARVREALHGARWLWVGTDFVQSDMIAFASPANAAPYLYAVPPDLACFGNLLTAVGVRARAERPSLGDAEAARRLSLPAPSPSQVGVRALRAERLPPGARAGATSRSRSRAVARRGVFTRFAPPPRGPPLG